MRYMSPRETEEYIVGKCKANEEEAKEELQTAMDNSFGIGQKKYILINPTLIHVPEWQRDTDVAKVTEIIDNFEEDKFDPVKLYMVNGRLEVADGAHRVLAFVKDKKMRILAEVLNCNENEAILTFLDQQSGRKNMTVKDMYRAGVEAKIKEYIAFKETFGRYNIQIISDMDSIKNPIGYVIPSREMLRMVVYRKDRMEEIINLLIKLNWNGTDKNVFTLRNFKVINKLIVNFGENAKQKLLDKCSGSVFYESKVFPVKSNAEMYDILAEIINK